MILISIPIILILPTNCFISADQQQG
jgi:hypothetical protein